MLVVFGPRILKEGVFFFYKGPVFLGGAKLKEI